MLDDADIQFRVLELEYKDYLSKREVIHYAEWGIPSGWFTGLLASGRVQDLVSLVLVGFVALWLFAIIRAERVKYDRSLEAICIMMPDILHKEKLPERFVESLPREATITERLIVFLIVTAFVTYFFSQMERSVLNFGVYLAILLFVAWWVIKGILKTMAENPQTNTK
jgi:hypothetical protein